ncbi:TonB-dependent receptor [Pseudothauera nasutitermitis]|uniref:TonB-dependent receptor n=1 Tax=Pseudothauera nasutitermitis TaxID=2565930 RepID=A0A4S4ATE5_9RHOO|nr:TonB-dependent receptor [Pseudothauera nasutitermitis]THF63157.1 TonB-dependent receptor [Pseudothauera nasutitermitis]
MTIRLSALASACALAFSGQAFADAAQDAHELAQVTVSATRIDVSDTAATYASEVHGREEIERSGATTLVDYLSRHTSLQMLPSYGNRFTPSLNMRGYGFTDGYQNVVISVDGRRMNNIDMVPQLLGSIMLADIERIEITRGSGAVMFGDGATAGTIQIHTRARTGVNAELYGGSHGTRGGVFSAGLAQERFSLSASGERSQSDGFSDKDPSGHRDESRIDTWRVALSGKPVDALELKLDAGRSRIDTRYPGWLTLAQFKDDPAQHRPGSGNYTHQKFDAEYWSVGGEYDFGAGWKLSANHHDESKNSEFSSGWSSDYRSLSDEVAVQYRGGALSAVAGVQHFDGLRKGADNKTSKRNTGWFAQGQYAFDRLTLSAGVRTERVEYEYRPTAGVRLKDDDRLSSWDVGFNYRVDAALSLFGNYNASFQAPDIDRFFSTDWMTGVTHFNGFIEPMRVRTVTLGLNHVTPANRLKVAVFHADLKNEIFYEPFSFQNTNIDRSHKYGLELQDTWQITPILTGLFNYTWTRAIIDRDDAGGGAFDGKELPGVPRHGVVLGLNVKVGDHGNLHLTHTWRSKAWATGDFDNNNLQKQRAYQSTDLAYRHRITKDVELYGTVSNLFERENGVWTRDDRIYPVDFERTWKLGARVSF